MRQEKRRFVMFVAVIVFLSFTLPGLASEGKININTATEKELCALKRVGPKYAKRIVKHRNQEGEFMAPKDIIKVKGIGPKTYEANKTIIVVKDGN